MKLDLNYIDQLFQCILYEEKGEKLLMEKNIQAFATYCLQGFIQILIEKRIRLDVDVDTTRILIRMEDKEEIQGNNIEQFNETLNYLKRFFDILNMYLLSRIMKVQTSNDK